MTGLHERMAARLPELTRRVVARCADEVPFYRDLPRETLDGQVSESVHAALLLSLRMMRDPDSLRPAELTWLVELSARRARESLPLEAALSGYLIGAREWWRTAAELAEPGELAEVGGRLLDGLRIVMSTVALAHQQALEDLRSEDKRARRELLAALLDGHPHEALAKAARVEVARLCVVMLDCTPRPPEQLLQSALDAQAGALVLADHAEGIVLVPGEIVPESLVAGLEDALEVSVLAAAAEAGKPGDVPQAADEVRRVMALVRRLGRPPGVYRFEDVLLEHQLARPGLALTRLAGKLAPLAEHDYLLRTLRAFVQHGRNRRQTALGLHIHRNTLDYRLQRITALTGLDFGVPEQARVIEAALIAWDLTRDE
ncbi:PucR family transcriptional regulator [Spirillospora sp. CA-294931]|uniref:PucR family transcriptional regulator n=1 Tax=Spirillospora sp. CA-294931 TaxID=3240042 RepID=UPI003D919A9A